MTKVTDSYYVRKEWGVEEAKSILDPFLDCTRGFFGGKESKGEESARITYIWKGSQ